MRITRKMVCFPVLLSCILSWTDAAWRMKKHKQFDVYYTKADKKELKAFTGMFEKGISITEKFFDTTYRNHFNIFIHPGRQSLDSTWEHDWNEKGFKSECWMVGSGTGKRFDLLSPLAWEKQACEHQYSNKEKTAELITHELIHVFHGQRQSIPDFSNTDKLDWFVEGLATYASGQLDTEKLSSLKKLISENKVPETLDQFWTGKYKYPLSGSVVMYIDKTFGRKMLIRLLPLTKKGEVLEALNITEAKLLADWRNFISTL
jgi:hypothetical protein